MSSRGTGDGPLAGQVADPARETRDDYEAAVAVAVVAELVKG